MKNKITNKILCYTIFTAFILSLMIPCVQAKTKVEDLPKEAQAYVAAIEESIGLPISMISVGPERDQIIPRSR